MYTPSNSLPPCEQFAELEEFDDTGFECAVCERLEISHANPGRRKLTVPQAEAERAAMIGASAEGEGL
jgi:hypothetical protein